MELPLAIVTLGTIRPENSRAAFEQKNEIPDMPRTGVNAQNSLLGE